MSAYGADMLRFFTGEIYRITGAFKSMNLITDKIYVPADLVARKSYFDYLIFVVQLDFQNKIVHTHIGSVRSHDIPFAINDSSRPFFAEKVVKISHF